MIRIRYSLYAFLLGVFAISCQDKHATTGGAVVWEINPNEAKETNLSEFVDSICIVPLETLDECLIKNVTSLTYTNQKFYVNNSRSGIQIYDKNGNFIYSTEGHQGPGPNEYRTALSLNLLQNDTLEILDVPAFSLRKYVQPEGIVHSLSLPRKLLPVGSCIRLNKDTLIFVAEMTNDNALKFYSQSKKTILRTIEDPQKRELVRTSDPLYKINGELYYSATYPSNELYVLNEDMEKELVLQLDFGKKNFSIEDLPKNLNPKSFRKDWLSDGRAYPYTKYILNNLYLAYFQINGKLYFAIKDKTTNAAKVYKNSTKAHSQMMIPHYVSGDSLFYASEPDYLPYLIDTTLMRKRDIAQLDSVNETDNPIVIIYKLKH